MAAVSQRKKLTSILLRKFKTVLRNPRAIISRAITTKDTIQAFIDQKTVKFFSRQMGWQIAFGPFDIYRTSRNMHPVDRKNIFRGLYEKEEREILKEFKEAKYIFDCGANIGFVARHAAKKLAKGGKYIAVEANPDSLEALCRNMAVTKRRNRNFDYRIIAAAVCAAKDIGKRVDFAVRADLSSKVIEKESDIRADERLVKVPARSLSSLIDEFVPEGEKVSLIMDIEGGEIALLDDPDAFKRVDQIAIELHEPCLTNKSITPDEMLKKFEALGFQSKMTVNRNCHLLVRVPA